MNKYELKHKGKSYTYKGKDVFEVAEKYENRKLFGRTYIDALMLNMYDTETMGKKWAVLEDFDGNRVEIDLIESEG